MHKLFARASPHQWFSFWLSSGLGLVSLYRTESRAPTAHNFAPCDPQPHPDVDPSEDNALRGLNKPQATRQATGVSMAQVGEPTAAEGAWDRSPSSRQRHPSKAKRPEVLQ